MRVSDEQFLKNLLFEKYLDKPLGNLKKKSKVRRYFKKNFGYVSRDLSKSSSKDNIRNFFRTFCPGISFKNLTRIFSWNFQRYNQEFLRDSCTSRDVFGNFNRVLSRIQPALVQFLKELLKTSLDKYLNTEGISKGTLRGIRGKVSEGICQTTRNVRQHITLIVSTIAVVLTLKKL